MVLREGGAAVGSPQLGDVPLQSSRRCRLGRHTDAYVRARVIVKTTVNSLYTNPQVLNRTDFYACACHGEFDMNDLAYSKSLENPCTHKRPDSGIYIAVTHDYPVQTAAPLEYYNLTFDLMVVSRVPVPDRVITAL